MSEGHFQLQNPLCYWLRPALQLHCSLHPPLPISASHMFTPPQAWPSYKNTEQNLHFWVWVLDNGTYYNIQMGCKLLRNTWVQNAVSPDEQLNCYHPRWSKWWVEGQKLYFWHIMFEICIKPSNVRTKEVISSINLYLKVH